jgi:hypothetical protein
MSLWLQHKDKDGKTHLYAVPFVPWLILPILGISIALLLPVVQAVRAWLGW